MKSSPIRYSQFPLASYFIWRAFCQSQSPNLSHPHLSLSVHCLHLHLCSCHANRFFCNILLNSTRALIYICFSLLTYFTLLERLGPSTSLQMTQHHSFWRPSIFQCVCVCVCVVVVVRCICSSDELLYILASSPRLSSAGPATFLRIFWLLGYPFTNTFFSPSHTLAFYLTVGTPDSRPSVFGRCAQGL